MGEFLLVIGIVIITVALLDVVYVLGRRDGAKEIRELLQQSNRRKQSSR